MRSNALLIGGILLVVLAILVFSATFTVQQTQQAVIVQFGAIQRTVSTPGLHFKVPFIQEVRYLEKRVLNLDPEAETIVLADQRRLIVDAFVRYRIVAPQQFIRVAISEANLRNRLEPIVNNALRSVLGTVLLPTILSEERDKLMQQITKNVNDAVNTEQSNFGIEVLDVRIVRADLLPEVSQAVYARMRAERERDAAEFRAQGEEQFQTITAQADRQATVIQAEAQRQSEILRGEGEAERTTILAKAFGEDPSFFAFYRSMQAYDQALKSDNTRFVLPPQGEFFRYFNSETGKPAATGSSQAPAGGASKPEPAAAAQ
ncbi:protease FtsH subunit HflC [Tistlia consotensis]|uniref:Protein HflC n=1 Tax=Tistlia consotensis USBA 355 TaxID=560819 RepID=A0A1Y6B9C3_9PROT|nr:protease modulator HflC [Tistlia consotensis]SME91395.1 protease FtsH subunit HflC [Tistlia consotensis USBA 355]SNR27349.1 protease FtsH subunit HflC [Tistlia consotensis]